jgi:hypothetical protein
MSKSYSIRTTVRDDFVPLVYNGQGGKTHVTGKVVPWGGEKKRNEKKRKSNGRNANGF